MAKEITSYASVKREPFGALILSILSGPKDGIQSGYCIQISADEWANLVKKAQAEGQIAGEQHG